MTVFEKGTLGYDTCRIPAVIALDSGRLLAFCEGRLSSASDSGKIDVLCRVSDDGGETWGDPRVIAQNGGDTVGNPCPVQSADGRVFLFLNTNLAGGGEDMINRGLAPRGVGYIFSDDCGESWSCFCDMTAELKMPDWGWYACGPGHALRMSDGTLVIPCNHSVINGGYSGHTVISTDNGKSWALSATVGQMFGNEATAAEPEKGVIYMNLRRLGGAPYRLSCISRDRGRSWENVREDTSLPDPSCEGSVLFFGGRLFFSNNPNLPASKNGNERSGLSVRESDDGGLTWSAPHPVCDEERKTAYSDLAADRGGKLLCLFENGIGSPYERISLEKINI